MTKEEKINYCIESAMEFGEGENDVDYWKNLNDNEIDMCIEWFDYLRTK